VNAWELGVLSDGGSFVAPSNTDALYDRLVSLGLVASASLVNSCNGGKADALYNFVPSPVQSLDRFTVTRASTKLVLGSDGLYGSVANNVPAFEFNTDGTYRGLLVEPGATNIVQRSQEFNDSYWSKVALNVTANASTSPDGATTADKLIPTAVSSQHRIDLTSTTTAAEHSFSVFAKADGYGFISLRMGSRQAGFSLSTGSSNSVEASTTVNAMQFPNGWWRFRISGVASLNSVCRINVENAGSIGTTFTGDGTSGVLLWQAQLETGLVATSPIVTTAGTASRVADVVSLTGASSLIGQTEGTLYAEVEMRAMGAVARSILEINDGSTDNRVTILATGLVSDTFRMRSIVGNVDQCVFDSAFVGNTIYKTTIGYKANDFAGYVNGAQIGIDASGSVPGVPQINIGCLASGTSQLNGWLRSVAIFPTRLTNATLASLTA
jgi:hypothetical protein